MSAFLTLERVGHTFADGTEVLRNITLSIRQGAFVAMVGQSGVGKSTLLRILGGLIRPKTGTLHATPPDPTIGIVFQKHNLMPWRTAYQNVRLPLEIAGVHGDEADRRVTQLLELVGLDGFVHTYPAQLSGGMAQRVALARALVHRPDLLLLDEPFGALDAITRERMGQELLRIWHALPVTVVMVTHSIPEAVRLADDVLVLGQRPGTLIAQTPVALPRPRTLAVEATDAFHAQVAYLRELI